MKSPSFALHAQSWILRHEFDLIVFNLLYLLNLNPYYGKSICFLKGNFTRNSKCIQILHQVEANQVMFTEIPRKWYGTLNMFHFPCHNIFCGTPAIKLLLFSGRADYNLSNNTLTSAVCTWKFENANSRFNIKTGLKPKHKLVTKTPITCFL